MLEETLRKWELKLRREGREEGYRQGFVEGFRQGFREARREAVVKGMRTLVLDTLRYRFGPLSKAVRQRVQEISSSSELTKLTRRILTASSLQETGLL